MIPEYTVYATPIDAPAWEIRALQTGLEFGAHPFDFSCIFKIVEPRVIEIRLAQVGPLKGMRRKLLDKAAELGADHIRFVHHGKAQEFLTARRRS